MSSPPARDAFDSEAEDGPAAVRLVSPARGMIDNGVDPYQRMIDDLFDSSDVLAPPARPDTLRDALDVACSVLADYGGDAQDTRIARLARWLVMNLGGQLHEQHVGGLSRVTPDACAISAVRAGDVVGLYTPSKQYLDLARVGSAEAARQVAAALLTCADHADAD